MAGSTGFAVGVAFVVVAGKARVDHVGPVRWQRRYATPPANRRSIGVITVPVAIVAIVTVLVGIAAVVVVPVILRGIVVPFVPIVVVPIVVEVHAA